MRREDVLQLISQHADELRQMGVTSLALFGSVGRDEARPDSDVDILIDLRRGIGLFGLFEIQRWLEDMLGVKVDLVTRGGVHPALRERIFGEAVDVIPAA